MSQLDYKCDTIEDRAAAALLFRRFDTGKLVSSTVPYILYWSSNKRAAVDVAWVFGVDLMRCLMGS